MLLAAARIATARVLRSSADSPVVTGQAVVRVAADGASTVYLQQHGPSVERDVGRNQYGRAVTLPRYALGDSRGR